MKIVLIGYRGTGKSTVAPQLASRLGWDWVDADVELERRAKKSIAAIFADDGAEAFRDRETAMLADLARRERTVVAAGGGAVLRAENRAVLASDAKLVWLRAEPATIVRRVAADGSTAARRPNLTSAGGIAEIETVLAERTPIYESCADLTVDTDGKTPGEVVGEIMARLDLPSHVELA
jgi:shikimate kinase